MAQDIARDSAPGPLQHGHTTVDTQPRQLTVVGTALRGVLLRTPGPKDPMPNTAPVWVGRGVVTADSATGSGGMPLAPGESMFIPIDNPSHLSVVSTTSDQDVAWMSL